MQYDVVLWQECGDESGAEASLSALAAADAGGCVASVRLVGRPPFPPPRGEEPPFLSLPTARPFARAVNTAAGSGAPWLVVLSAGSRVCADFFARLDTAAQRRPDAAAFACRRLPFEAEYPFDPVSLAAAFFDAPPFAVSGAFWQALGGLDARLPEKAACIDFSLRLRGAGGQVYYLPEAVVTEAGPAPTSAGAAERDAYVEEEYGRLLLGYKYGGAARANRRFYAVLRRPRHYPGVRRGLTRRYLRHFIARWPLLGARLRQSPALRQAAAAARGQLFFARGRHPLPAPVTSGPLFSVIVRTHARPRHLQNALQSIANQTYTNYEVIVVEDGTGAARAVAESFPGMPVRYHATETPVGRGRAGNLGLGMAAGDYCNFLDDDDYFYPDHLERMAALAAENPEADIILGCSVAMKTDEAPPAAEQRLHAPLELIRFDRLDAFTLCQMCQIPLLSACFKRGLYQACGGLDEEMDGHEDWAMWLRFLSRARRIHPHGIDLPRATSVFTQPAARQAAHARLAGYRAFDKQLFADPEIRFDVSMAQMRAFYDGMLADVAHLRQTGGLDAFLRREQNRERLPQDGEAEE